MPTRGPFGSLSEPNGPRVGTTGLGGGKRWYLACFTKRAIGTVASMAESVSRRQVLGLCLGAGVLAACSAPPEPQGQQGQQAAAPGTTTSPRPSVTSTSV